MVTGMQSAKTEPGVTQVEPCPFAVPPRPPLQWHPESCRRSLRFWGH